MPTHDPGARERLLQLLGLELGVDLDYDDFRREYEHTFNFELDRTSLADRELQVFQTLFDRVVWYSPFAQERAAIPNYIGEAEMDAAVAEARRALGIDVRKIGAQ